MTFFVAVKTKNIRIKKVPHCIRKLLDFENLCPFFKKKTRPHTTHTQVGIKPRHFILESFYTWVSSTGMSPKEPENLCNSIRSQIVFKISKTQLPRINITHTEYLNFERHELCRILLIYISLDVVTAKNTHSWSYCKNVK